MVKIILILLLWISPVWAFTSFNSYMSGGSEFNLINTTGFETGEGFSDASGSNIDIYNDGSGENGWVATLAARFYLSNDQAETGTQAIFCDCQLASQYLTKMFSPTTDDFWLDLEYLGTDVSGDSTRFGVSDGDPATAANVAIKLRIRDDDIEYYTSGGGWQDVCTDCVGTDTTWYHIQVWVQTASKVYDVWLDGVEKATGLAFEGTPTAPDRFYINDYGNVDDDAYYDQVRAYHGTRQ